MDPESLSAQEHDPRAHEERVIGWVPLAVPLLAVLLIVCAFLIEADVL